MPLALHLFDEGTAGATTAESGIQEGTAAHTLPSNKASAKSGELKNVVYGKQIEPIQPVAEAKADTTSSPMDLRAKYDEFMQDKAMKQFYNEDTQKIINKRFKESKGLQESLGKKEEILSLLRERYNATDDEMLSNAIQNDNLLWEDTAAQMGMTVDQYREYTKISREQQQKDAMIEQYQRQEQARHQYNQWLNEAQDVKAKYPEFDLNAELANPNFAGLIAQRNPQYQISMTQAYEICHLDDVKAQTASATEKNVVNNIRAKGQRPVEGAVNSQSAVIVKNDVSKLTRRDREEIAKRAAKGEQISF